MKTSLGATSTGRHPVIRGAGHLIGQLESEGALKGSGGSEGSDVSLRKSLHLRHRFIA